MAEENKLMIPVSIGELWDKITILEIKLENIVDERRVDVLKELHLLLDIAHDHPIDDRLYEKLRTANIELWAIEDKLRDLEREKDFGDEFVTFARSVYFTNDRRSDIKGLINMQYGSEVVEVKSYKPY